MKKNNSKNIIFIHFGYLRESNDNLSGVYFSVIKKLSLENNIKIFTLSNGINTIYQNIEIRSFENIFIKILIKLSSIIVPKSSVRFYKEYLFDLWIKRNVDKEVFAVFCDRPLYPRTLEKAKKSGIKVISIASVPHPLINYSLVYEQITKYKLKSKSTYLNKKWINEILKSLRFIDKLLLLAHSRNFYYLSYSLFLKENKIVRLHNYFRLKFSDKKKHSQKDNSKIIFTHLSHINLIKGVQYLLEAWDKIKPELKKKAELIIAGKMDKDIQKIIRAGNFNLSKVQFTGWIDNKSDLISKTDIFISPSISDAGPQTIIEFLSNGIPVISSDHCGNADLIVNYVNGFVYQYNDTDELKNRIEFIIKNPNYFDNKNIIKSVQNISTENFINEVASHILN